MAKSSLSLRGKSQHFSAYCRVYPLVLIFLVSGHLCSLSYGQSQVPFALHVISSIADGPLYVFGVDMDFDGDVDIVSSSSEDDEVFWFENDGHENFTKRLIMSGADGAHWTYVVDLDADQDLDVVSSSILDNQILWHENDGSMQFTPHVIYDDAQFAFGVHAADIDGDGDLDVLSGSREDNKVAWFENDGSMGFTTHIISTSAIASSGVVAVDLDQDGDVDAVGASRDDGHVTWYENDGQQNFTPRVLSSSLDGARMIEIVDINQDGDLDIFVGAWFSEVTWLENDGANNFEMRTISGGVYGNSSLDAADIDLDGDLDLYFVAGRANTVGWYENDGTQQFTAHVLRDDVKYPDTAFASDVDGDGDVDLLTSAWIEDEISWYENLTVRKNHDLRVESLPTHLYNVPAFANNIAPEVVVKNFGFQDESVVSVRCEIDSAGILIYSDTKMFNELRVLESITVTFDDWHTLDVSTYGMTLYTELSDDEDKSNDTLRAAINVSNLVDDFESGFGKWDSDTGWGIDPTPHSGLFGMDNSPSDRYANNMDASAVYKYGFDLSDFDNAQLSFWSYPLMVTGDSGFVEISTDSGSSWERLGVGQTGLKSTWTRHIYSLQSFSGSDDVRLKFRFISDESRVAIGWFIDDIRIYADSTATDVLSHLSGGMPSAYGLLNNYPNPFNPSTRIIFHLPVKRHLDLAIYDIRGNRVRTLTSGQHLSGAYSIIWDGKNDNGLPVASGLYFLMLQAGEFTQVKKMTLLR